MRWGVEVANELVDAFRDGWVDHPLQLAGAVVGSDGIATAGDTDLLFEIGSITKTMTATLLALAVVDGTAALDDPVSRWLDAGPNGDITLLQLATHTSGLPRLAPTHQEAVADPEDPYAAFAAAHAEAGLREAERSDIGSQAYSNFGFQLLGLVVERIAGVPYDELIRRELFDPFGMTTARMTGFDGPQAQGFRSSTPVGHWHLLLPGPGGVEATAADLAAYAAGVVAPPTDRLRAAVALTSAAPLLGWAALGDGIWHNGGTGGFHAMLAIDPAEHRAALLLVADTDLDAIDNAVAGLLRGEDPKELRPMPVDGRWGDLALGLVPLLVERRWPELRSTMSTEVGEVLTDERLDGGWDAVMVQRGGFQGATVTRVARNGAVVTVALALTFDDEPGVATLSFTAEDDRLVGLHIA